MVLSVVNSLDVSPRLFLYIKIVFKCHGGFGSLVQDLADINACLGRSSFMLDLENSLSSTWRHRFLSSDLLLILQTNFRKRHLSRHDRVLSRSNIDMLLTLHR